MAPPVINTYIDGIEDLPLLVNRERAKIVVLTLLLFACLIGGVFIGLSNLPFKKVLAISLGAAALTGFYHLAQQEHSTYILQSSLKALLLFFSLFGAINLAAQGPPALGLASDMPYANLLRWGGAGVLLIGALYMAKKCWPKNDQPKNDQPNGRANWRFGDYHIQGSFFLQNEVAELADDVIIGIEKSVYSKLVAFSDANKAPYKEIQIKDAVLKVLQTLNEGEEHPLQFEGTITYLGSDLAVRHVSQKQPCTIARE